MFHYYVYENKEFMPATEDEVSGKYSFMADITTTVADIDNSDDFSIEVDYIASNEVDVTNMSEVLDLAQMFRVDENHERLSQKISIDLKQ